METHRRLGASNVINDRRQAPGIMEAANRGAHDAGAPIGFNITIPGEQQPNAYSTPDLTFRFHYFAMRKMHLAMRARALAVFPGGFGTMDELFEILTLQQTQEASPTPVVLVGEDYWNSVINFNAMIDSGLGEAADLKIFEIVNTGAEAWAALKARGLKPGVRSAGKCPERARQRSGIAPFLVATLEGLRAGGGGAGRALVLETEGDAALGQVIGGHLDRDAVAFQDADAIACAFCPERVGEVWWPLSSLRRSARSGSISMTVPSKVMTSSLDMCLFRLRSLRRARSSPLAAIGGSNKAGFPAIQAQSGQSCPSYLGLPSQTIEIIQYF